MRLVVLGIAEGLFRVCDLDNNVIRDLTKKQVEELVKSGAKLENLYMTNSGSITFHPGYASIENGEVVKDKLYIIDSEENRHKVINIKGKIGYADNTIILNNMNSIMNSVDCNIPPLYKNTSKYSGELLNGNYTKMIVGSCFNRNIKTGFGSLTASYYKVIRGKLESKYITSQLDLDLNKITYNNGVYFYNNDTILCGNVYTKVYDKDTLLKILSSSVVTSIIDKELIDYELKYKTDKSMRDKETGVLIPKKSIPYLPIVVNINDLQQNKCTNSIEEANRYFKIISKISAELWVLIPSSRKKFLVKRNVTNTEITYKEIEVSNYIKENTLNIEEVYKKRSEYANVTIEDNNTIIIHAIDGVYRYNIEKIYDEYKSKIVLNNKAKKAAILGIDYKEKITEGGVLLDISSDREEIIINDSVNTVKKHSIKLRAENKKLIIYGDIKNFSANAIEGIYDNNLNYIEINFNDVKSGINLIKNVIEVFNYRQSLINIKYNRDIDKEELAYWITYGNNVMYTLYAPNLTRGALEDEYAVYVFKSMVSKKCGNIANIGKRETYNKFKLLKPMTTIYGDIKNSAFLNMASDIKFMRECFKFRLKPMCSPVAAYQIERIIEDISNRLRDEIEDYNKNN